MRHVVDKGVYLSREDPHDCEGGDVECHSTALLQL